MQTNCQYLKIFIIIDEHHVKKNILINKLNKIKFINKKIVKK